jgi:hypothetical protein
MVFMVVPPDIFLVDQHLVHGAARPRAAKIGGEATSVEQRSNLAFGPAVLDERPVYRSDRLDFPFGSGHQDDAVCLDALLFTAHQLALGSAGLIDQFSTELVSGSAALAVPQFDQATLAGENLGR